jgi:SAM-dependent methyltransferase
MAGRALPMVSVPRLDGRCAGSLLSGDHRRIGRAARTNSRTPNLFAVDVLFATETSEGAVTDLDACIVCHEETFETLHDATFDGTAKDAVPCFLTDREKAVHGRIVQCRGCGFVFTSPQFAAAEYSRIYAQVASDGDDEGRRRANMRRFAKLASLVRPYVGDGRFFDLGAGDGGFLDAMGDADGTGFEIRDVPPSTADGRGRGIVTGDFIAACADPANGWQGAFDFVTGWDVLEHLPDLAGHMQAVHGLLRDGGYFFCTVPNVASLNARLSGRRWNMLLLEHLWYFAPSTFKAFAARQGFEVLACRGITYPSDFGTLLLRLAQTFGSGSFRPPKALGSVPVSLPIGLMFVVCRKAAAGG